MLTLELTSPGRKAVPHKPKNRHNAPFAKEKFAQAHSGEQEPRQVDLFADFERAADDGSSEGRKPTVHPKIRRYERKRKRDNDYDREC